MTSHIKIPDTTPVIHYRGDTVQTQFTFPFPVLDHAHLTVILNGATVTSGYTVDGIGSSDGGTVTFANAPALDARITLQRTIPIQRISDFMEGGELSSNALNNEFDIATAIMQELQHKQKQALHYRADDPSQNTSIPHAPERAGRLLGFDDNGDPLLYDIHNGENAVPPATYTQDGAGAVTRPLTAKAKEHVSIADFGAIGDGITDDSAAFINALAAHPCVYIPSGRYAIGQTIPLTDNQTLFGAGASSVIVALTDNFDVITIDGSHCRVHDLAIESGDTGIRICCETTSADHNRVTAVSLSGQHIAIEIDGGINPTLSCHGTMLEHITITDCEAYGVLVTRSGLGTVPTATWCNAIAITSDTVPLQNAAFAIECANATSLAQCTVHLHGGADICLVGSESVDCALYGLNGISADDGDGFILQAGSQNTFLHGCVIDTGGTVLHDLSGGSYCAVAMNNMQQTDLRHVSIKDLTTHARRNKIRTVSLPGALPFYADLSHSLYMVSAQNGEVVFFLPKASEANNGFVFTIKKTDTTNNQVVINEVSGTGPDGRMLHLGSDQDRVTVISDGSMWRMIESNIDIMTFMTVTTAGTHLIDPARNLYLVNASAGAINIVLPAPANPLSFRRIVTIKKIDSTTNTVTITTSGGGGPDTAAYTLNTRFSAVTVACIGSTWYVIGKV